MKKESTTNEKLIEIKKQLGGFIAFYKLDTSVEEIEQKIYNASGSAKSATHEYNQWRVDKIDYTGHEISQNMIDMMTAAWNNFPQKSLGGKSPREAYIEAYGIEPPSSL